METFKTKFRVQGAMESRQGGRPENQDDCGYVDTPYGFLAVVCDGMGGGPGGKTASYIAKTAIMQTLQSQNGEVKTRREILELSIANACRAVLQKTDEVPALKGMGSTAVMVLVSDKQAYICHVGDSRCYQIRGKKMVFRTNDHSMVGQLVRAGQITEEQARLSAQSNIITQAIGSKGTVEPEIDIVPYKAGDRFVLCTDGIWGAVPEPELVKMFAQKKSLHVLAETIAIDIDTIGKNTGGHHDNLTLSIVETQMDSDEKPIDPSYNKLWIGLVAAAVLAGALYFFFSGNEEKPEVPPTTQKAVEVENNAKKVDDKQKPADKSEDKVQKEVKSVEAKPETTKTAITTKTPDSTKVTNLTQSPVSEKTSSEKVSVEQRINQLKSALDACLNGYNEDKKNKVMDIASELVKEGDEKTVRAATEIKQWIVDNKGRQPNKADINFLKVKLDKLKQ